MPPSLCPRPLLQIIGQRKKASCFAILDAQGAAGQLAELLVLAEQGRRQWHTRHG